LTDPRFFSKLNFPPTPILPLVSLAALPVIAYGFLFSTPLTSHKLNNLSFKPQHFGISFPTLTFFSFVLGMFVFREPQRWVDVLLAGFLFRGSCV